MILCGASSRNGACVMTIDELTAKGPGALIAGIRVEGYPRDGCGYP